MRDEARKVFTALAERWNPNREDLQTVEQILAKASGDGLVLEILVGRREHAHVGADRLVTAQALEFLLLQQPQQLGLRAQRHVADFVEEERPLVSLLELADAATVGSGEGALLVAE